MSKLYEVSTEDYNLKFAGPASVEEFDQAAGKVGSLLEDGVMSVAWRSTLPEFHSAFIPKMEELTGVSIGIDEKATLRAKEKQKDPNKETKPIREKFSSYNRRARAACTPEQLKELSVIAQQIADTISIDPSPSRRASGPGTANLSKADAILTLSVDEIENKVAKFLAKVDFDLDRNEDGKPERVSFATLIKLYVDAIVNE